jgi:chemotaxis protein MotB
MVLRSQDDAGRAPNARFYQPTARDRWMVSYLDVLTIVLMFFLGIAAKSLHHPQPGATLKVTPSPPPQIRSSSPPAAVPSQSRQALLRAQKILEQHGIDLRMEPQGLRISLPQAVLFASGEDRVTQEALPIISCIADVLRDIPNDVKLVGHADAIPIHNRRFESNWSLAMARSLRIQELLSQRYGIPEARLSIASYGPYRPNSSNATPDGRSQNRRVEIVILDEQGAPV